MHIVPELSMLKDGTIEVDGTDMPVFEVEVIPGDDSDESKLKFGW